jgi:DNA-binding transcriptional ArsR family regulator
MENDNLLKLTNVVYRLLEFFPEADPLKNRTKDKALSIMENLTLVNETSGWASFQKEKVKVQLLQDIDMLLGYFWIAKSQDWLNSVNYLIISDKYEKIKKEIEPIIEPSIGVTHKLPDLDNTSVLEKIIDAEPKKLPESVLNNRNVGVFERDAPHSFSITTQQAQSSYKITARQRKILEFLKENEKAQVMDLQTVLSEVTKRTIRRDLDELLEAKKISRFGEFNQVFYKIK